MSNQLPLDRWADWYRKIPYGKVGVGYKVDKEDPLHIIPDEDTIAYLEQGFDYLEAGSSLREVCEWLQQKLLRSMVHQTVNNLYTKHRKPFIKKSTKITRQKAPLSKEQRKIAEIKRQATLNAKRAQKLEKALEAKKGQLKAEDFPDGPPVLNRINNLPNNPDRVIKENPPVLKGTDINWVFKPNPGPQTSFLSATEEEVLYGGGAGGGKSYAMLADPMRYFYNPNFVGLLLRRTNDELRELIWESQKIYPKAFVGAKWKQQQSMWEFPSGAKFWITYLDRDEDVQRYQGQAFCWIGLDELTQYPTPFAYLYLKSRLRSADPELEKNLSMRATTNPGGPGHQWVKKMFIDPAPAGTAFWATDINTGEVLKYPDNYTDPETNEPSPKAGLPLNKRKFIPALLRDNPYLAKSGHYEKNLLGLPEEQRRKLLEGDWSVVEGAAFSEFSPKYHVIKPFDIPPSWRRFRAADYGYSSPSCVLWFAIDPQDETLYVYRELYGSGMTGLDLAHKVLDMEKQDKISYGVLDSSVWHKRGHIGPSVAEEMIAAGCRWRESDRGDGSRVAGKNRLHELLKLKEDAFGEKKPGIIFFDNCRQIISDLPSIPTDPDGGDDIDDRYTSDHSYDALRYGIMSRPRASSPLDWGRQVSYRYVPADGTFGY